MKEKTIVVYVTCPVCNGKKVVGEEKCLYCDGKGKIKTKTPKETKQKG